jgi:uncharacterized delta-60 repeat protein
MRWLGGLAGAAVVAFLGIESASAQRVVYDPAFASGGALRIPQPMMGETPFAAMLLPDGRVLLGGIASPQNTGPQTGLLAMLSPTGQLDSTFGSGGIFRTSLLSPIEALALTPTGSLVVAGPGENGQAIGVGRLSLGAAFDPSFGGDGVAALAFSGGGKTTNALAVQPDGKIITVGGFIPERAADQGDMVIARFRTDGFLDTSFNIFGGRVVENFAVPGTLTSIDFARAVAIAPDGKIVVAGAGGNIIAAPGTFSGGARVIRYNPNGTRDTSFGEGGSVVSDFGISNGILSFASLHLFDDGRILAAGRESHGRFLMAMYNVDGSPVTSFGQNGTVLVEGFSSDQPVLQVRPDGSIRMAAVGAQLYDAVFDPLGQLLSWTALDYAPLPFAPTHHQEYNRVLILDDGDILAFGITAPNNTHSQPDWPYTTDLLISRFERTANIPEPAAALFVAAALLSTRRRAPHFRPRL